MKSTLGVPVADYWQARADVWSAEKASLLRSCKRLNLELRRLRHSRATSCDLTMRAHITEHIRQVKLALDAAHEDVRTTRQIAFKIRQMVEEVRAI